MICYHYDSNAIMFIPLKSCAKSEMVKAFQTLYASFSSQGLAPTFHQLDNEASFGLK